MQINGCLMKLKTEQVLMKDTEESNLEIANNEIHDLNVCGRPKGLVAGIEEGRFRKTLSVKC